MKQLAEPEAEQPAGSERGPAEATRLTADNRGDGAGGRDSLADPMQAADQREALLHQRELAVDRRDRLSEERERLADERERLADERERLADERERLADERERLADERERTANQRDERADSREGHVDEVARRIHVATSSQEGRVLEAIQRSRDRLAESTQRLDRGHALIERTRRKSAEDQVKVDSETAASERDLSASPVYQEVAAGSVIPRTAELRRRLAAAAMAVAKTEEEVARVHGRLASEQPHKADEYQRVAEQARVEAGRAHDTASQFRDAP